MHYEEQRALQVQFQAQHYELNPAEKEKMDESLDSLRELVRSFPVAQLHVLVNRHPRRNDFHVKTSLRLTGQTLFTGERDERPYRAFERCARKLVNKVKAYKERLENRFAWDWRERIARGPLSGDQAPAVEPRAEAKPPTLEGAHQAQDYHLFRRRLEIHDDRLLHCIGRSAERFPEVEARLGKDLILPDILEELYLNAFEDFGGRPQGDPVEVWLETLIDLSIRSLLHRPEEERENQQRLQELPPGRN